MTLWKRNERSVFVRSNLSLSRSLDRILHDAAHCLALGGTENGDGGRLPKLKGTDFPESAAFIDFDRVESTWLVCLRAAEGCVSVCVDALWHTSRVMRTRMRVFGTD